MAQRTQQFTALAAKLDALSPLKVLGRGYAVARNEQGQILRAAQEAAAGEKKSRYCSGREVSTAR